MRLDSETRPAAFELRVVFQLIGESKFRVPRLNEVCSNREGFYRALVVLVRHCKAAELLFSQFLPIVGFVGRSVLESISCFCP